MLNNCYENYFDLHENETACRTHFHIKDFALRLVLKQEHKRTRKWLIALARTCPCTHENYDLQNSVEWIILKHKGVFPAFCLFFYL